MTQSIEMALNTLKKNKIKTKTKKKIIFSIATLISTCGSAQAAPTPELLNLHIEPIIGYERVQEIIPTLHMTSRLIYGARATAGIPLLSVEAEYTHGTNQETFPTISQTDTVDHLKGGVRSSMGLFKIVSFHLRAGCQATQEVNEQTENGVTSKTKQAITYQPYGGAGVELILSRRFSATTDVLAIFPDLHDLSQTGYQTTAGFAIRLP